ncbi:nucleoporin subcomplex protein binding to Pom34-domain-containing protein [Phascolomyces articulosus]|uniref:Nucleoporin subcomplex protein binding to Pom34-domain-containing protein n=1 Tax=Phascolomyces articulosus TaxID=60185 RepID=A0AAD5K0V1_9FUNG|nr:nucleoporin subcomplex protein binding to Pom34-domain-containing protein [Phascolomyces articulosus]
MAPVPQSAQMNERFAGTYRKLFDTIEHGGDQCSIDRLQTLLAEKTKNLSLGLDAFGLPSSQSRSKLGSSVSIDGKTIKLDPAEKDFVIKATDFLHLNELSCVSLWTAFKQQYIKPPTIDKDDPVQQQRLLHRLTEFYYEDRIALLQCIASLLRIAQLGDHVFTPIAEDTIKQLINDEWTERLLKQLKERVRAPVPPQNNTGTTEASEWAKQNLREQKGLLEILFLTYYFKPCPPKFCLALLQEFEATSFCQRQTLGYVLDNDGTELCQQVSYLAVLLMVEALNLNTLRSSPKGESLLSSPAVAIKMANVAAFLGDREEHSVFLLAWSSILYEFNELLGDDECDPAYAPLQQFIHGELEISSNDLLTDRPMTRDTIPSTARREPSIQSAPEIYRLYAGRAIKRKVFDYMHDILKNRICDEEEANSIGYHDVLKSVISAFLSSIDPIYLPPDSYSSLIQCTCKLFEGQSVLAAKFWCTTNDSIQQLLSMSRNRFPTSIQTMTQLLSSMTGATNETRDIVSEEPAKHVFEYLKKFQTLAVVLKDLSKVNKEVHEDQSIVIRAAQPIHVLQDFGVVRGLTLAPGTEGLLVSREEDPPAVQWGVDYSCWHLFVSVLAGFVQRNNGNRMEMDIQDEDNVLSGKDYETVNNILNLIQRILQVSPSLATELVDHIEQQLGTSVPEGGQRRYPSKILVSLLCEVLDTCCLAENQPVDTITATIRCLTALLPYYRDDIWTYFEQAMILPWSNTSYSRTTQLSSAYIDPSRQIQQIVTNTECKTGSYSLLLAFLDLVTTMVRDVQHKWWEPDHVGRRQRQIEVLYFCLYYLMIDVFPSYAHWRYKHLSERFLIGCKVLSIFIEISHYFRDSTPTTSTTPENASALTLGALRDQIMGGFLYDGGIYHITPLLDTVRNGAAIANNLYHLNRPKEAERAERMTELTFVFIKTLLQRRLETIGSGSTRYESALERFMLERSTDGNTPDFLLRLMNHIDYTHNIRLSILATDIVTLLCRGLPAWKRTPNFVRHLGDKDQAQSIIKRYLSTAQDETQNEDLLASIWQMLTLMMETQPSLAILFLECHEYIMPSPKSAVKLLGDQRQANTTPTITLGGSSSKATQTESATRAAVDLLGHWEMLSVEKPTVLSNVLRFLATFWQTAFEHYALVQRTRSDSALWDALGKILLNPTQLEEPSNLHLTRTKEDDEHPQNSVSSDGNEIVRRICCANISKAFVMRIMAFEMQLTAGAEPESRTAFVDKLPAGLKSLLTKIGDPNKLAVMRTSFVKNSFDSQLTEIMEKDGKHVVNEIGSADESQLLCKVDMIGYGDNDASGEPRQYGDCYLYDVRLAYVRAQSILKHYSAVYNVSLEEDENVLVTPEVFAVRKAKESINRFLVAVCAVNHNWSIVDTQMIAFQSFKVFTETCSKYANELIWKASSSAPAGGLNATSLFDFLSGLTQHASDRTTWDTVSLAHYTIVIEFIRDLTEDWIASNRHILTGTDRNQKRLLADKLFTLLDAYCNLLRRDNYAFMDSIGSRSEHVFHRPLLESILLPLRSLRKIYTVASDFKDSHRLKGCLLQLLETTCDTFKMMVYKVASYSCTPGLSDQVQESCVKDMTVVTGLVTELIHPNFHSGPDQWLPTFRRCETIPNLLKLIHGGIELVVSEVNRPLDANSSVNVSPYAVNGLYLLLALSSTSDSAAALVNEGVIDLFCNNALSPLLKQGGLDMFLRFGDQSGFVERNPLHIIWCHMLCVISNILQSLGNSNSNQRPPQLTDKVFRGTVAFLQIYGTQVERTFSLVNGGPNSLFGLLPLESLSSCLLEEVDRLSMIIYNLSRQLDRIMSFSAGIFISYKNSALTLLQRFLYFFNHPAHMRAQLYPINQKERRLAESILSSPFTSTNNNNTTTTTTSSTSPSSFSLSAFSTATSTKTTNTTSVDGTEHNQLMHLITQKCIHIQRNILATFILLTQANRVVIKPDEEWPFGNAILYPNLRTQGSASLGTFMESVNAAMSFFKAYNNDHSNTLVSRELLSIVEGSMVLLTTQVALWINKPDLDQSSRREIIDDCLVEIAESLTKTYNSLNHISVSVTLKEPKEKTMTQLAVLKRFLADRYFNV